MDHPWELRQPGHGYGCQFFQNNCLLHQAVWLCCDNRSAPPGRSPDGRRSDSEVLSNSATRLLRPWLEEQGLLGDGWGGTTGDSWGDKAGFSFGVDAGSTGAVWVVPHAADLYVLACTWMAGPDGESRPEFWGDSHLMMLALEPMAESFEFLPAEE